MKKNFMFLALASLGLGLASCNGGFKQAEGGLLYEIHSTKGNPLIQPGDFISLNLVIKTDGDSVLTNTYDQGHPVQSVVPKPMAKGDIFAGLQLLAEGDSATLKVPADSVFKKGQQRPPGFKGKYLVYDIKIIKVIAKGKLSQSAFNQTITNYMQAEAAELNKVEPVKIKTFIAHEKLNAIKTPDNLYYQITQPGTGPTPAVGDTVVVNYTGRYLNGKIFDSSLRDSLLKSKTPVDPMRSFKPMSVPVGQRRVIQGLDEGLMLLNKGAKAIFVIPSSLARGIPIMGPIAFNIEVVDIIHPNPNAPKPIQPTLLNPNPQIKQQQAPVKK